MSIVEPRASRHDKTSAMGAMEVGTTKADAKDGLRSYYKAKIEEFEIAVRDKTQNLRRLEAQRNELNTKGEFFPSFFAPLFAPSHPNDVCAHREKRQGRKAYTRRVRSRASFVYTCTKPSCERA